MLDDPGLPEAPKSDQFRQILDGLPIAIAVSENCDDGVRPSGRLRQGPFERLTGRPAAALEGAAWSGLAEVSGVLDLLLADSHDDDYLGCCEVPTATGTRMLDCWANVIRDDAGRPLFRIVAAAEFTDPERDEAIRRIRDKETALRELQQRGNGRSKLKALHCCARPPSATVDGLRVAIGRLTPQKCANHFAALGYDAD